jgi:hypothetical protein
MSRQYGYKVRPSAADGRRPKKGPSEQTAARRADLGVKRAARGHRVASLLRRFRRRGGHLVVHVVVMVMVMVVVMHLMSHRGGGRRRRGFLRNGVTGEADRESSGGE